MQQRARGALFTRAASSKCRVTVDNLGGMSQDEAPTPLIVEKKGQVCYVSSAQIIAWLQYGKDLTCSKDIRECNSSAEFTCRRVREPWMQPWDAMGRPGWQISSICRWSACMQHAFSAHNRRYASVFAPHRRRGSEGRMRLVDPQRMKEPHSDLSRCFDCSKWELPGALWDCQ